MEAAQTKEIEIDYTKLTEARQEKKMSKADVANALGFDRRQIWAFERGTGVTLANFTKLMFFYDKPIEFFLKK